MFSPTLAQIAESAKNELGEGVLTWKGSERRSDRYGAIYLIQEGHNSLTQAPSPSIVSSRAAALIGQRGDLVAVVMQNRDSTHIGDLFRGVGPSKPEIGEIIVLGTGELFTESAPEGGLEVGLRPLDGRPADWLDIKALYRAHEQTVKLYFSPMEQTQ